jgi:hypothetical protein
MYRLRESIIWYLRSEFVHVDFTILQSAFKPRESLPKLQHEHNQDITSLAYDIFVSHEAFIGK